ncbi:MAG: hypothetical protein GYB31_20820 [Bacteroidetes bacterium]|nr:hypothetical protein [Bacteroidota bacterium]
MKKILLPALVTGVVLFGFCYFIIWFSIQFMPQLLEEYYNPIFYPGSKRSIFFYIHPFVLAIALSWFWEKIKSSFKGVNLIRGIEFGLVYGLVATLPMMWLTFSSLDVTIIMVLMWLVYGLAQATIAGLIFARMNP